jgi:outer membrane protein OmpA-like peptidoglycan-associated protein
MADELFDTGSSTIKSDAALEPALTAARQGNGSIEVEGYADVQRNRNPGGNQQLSEDRANAVKQWLTDHGIADSRITAVGHGETQIFGAGRGAAALQQNRRVEVTVQPDAS